jgi:stage V sporulation protein SpoVS
MSEEDAVLESDANIIRVSKTANPTSVASVLARAILNGNTDVKLRGIGAGPVNQAAKAAAIASQFTAPRGIYLHFSIYFEDVPGKDGKDISAVTFAPIIVR